MSKPLFTEKHVQQFWQGYAQSNAPEPMLKMIAGLRAMTAEDEQKPEPAEMICENAEKCLIKCGCEKPHSFCGAEAGRWACDSPCPESGAKCIPRSEFERRKETGWRANIYVGGETIPADVKVTESEIQVTPKPEIQRPPMVGDVVESRSGRIMTVVAVRADEAWIQSENYRDVTYIHNLEIISRPEPKVGDVFEWKEGAIVDRCTRITDKCVWFGCRYFAHIPDFVSKLNSGEIKRIYRSEK